MPHIGARITALTALALAAACGGNGDVTQPVEFNHALHVGENDIACSDCHRNVRKGDSAGFPGIQICVDCHEEPLGESAEEKKVVAAIKEGKELQWKRIYRVPVHVHYPHARHVVLGKIECTHCHGPIDKAETPPRKPFRDFSMDFCLECHKESGATSDCIACHK